MSESPFFSLLVDEHSVVIRYRYVPNVDFIWLIDVDDLESGKVIPFTELEPIKQKLFTKIIKEHVEESKK